MPTDGNDHIAMPTANAERLIPFYKRLGFPAMQGRVQSHWYMHAKSTLKEPGS
jgi:hypothetical protein